MSKTYTKSILCGYTKQNAKFLGRFQDCLSTFSKGGSYINSTYGEEINCSDTTHQVLRSPGILLHRCFDNIMSQSSTKHTCTQDHTTPKLYFVLQKGCLWTGLVQLDTPFSFLCTLDYTCDHHSPFGLATQWLAH